MFNKKATTKDRGFTLIELLVVISIIALLSVIVMSSMEEARNRARNSAKNSLVREYINALELYRNANTSYPNPGDTGWHCLGNGSGSCQDMISPERTYNATLISNLNAYISGPPTDQMNIKINGYDMSGVAYRCLNSNCSIYELQWFLIGSVDCLTDATPISFLGNKRCNYIIN